MPTLLNRVNSSRSTISKDLKCVVQLLDDSQTITVEFKKDDVGQVVLDYVCEMLNLVEKDYFGLRYVDANRHRYWLDLSKPILRQVKRTAPIVFAFRVKCYPVDPTVLHEQLTRYLITLQLKRDLLHGRLYCPQIDAAALGAYIVQSELGDYDPAEHKGNYVSQFKMFLNQTPRLEEKIALEHQQLRGKGITPSDADFEFLKKASQLDTYGYYPFTVRDTYDGQLYIGATPRGLLIYQAHKKLHHLRWSDIKGFDYTGKEFLINITDEYSNDHEIGDEEGNSNPEDDGSPVSTNGAANETAQHDPSGGKKKPRLRFICPSATFCKHIWKYMLGQQAFFTKQKSQEVKPVVVRRGPFFKRATFRYTGRVLQEIKESSSPRRPEPAFERIHIQRQLPRDERNAPWANKFHTLPRTMKAVPEESLSDVLNKTAPADTPSTQNNILLDATAQSTPVTTPISQSVENGPWSTGISNGKTTISSRIDEVSFAEKTPPPDNTHYQSEVITVCLKRVEHKVSSETQQQPKNGFPAFPQDSQQPEKMDEQPRAVLPSPSTNQAIIKTKPRWTYRALTRAILTGLMFVVLLILTVVFIMEVQDAQFRRYIRQITGDDAFRRNVYNPLRRRVVDTYDRMFQ